VPCRHVLPRRRCHNMPAMQARNILRYESECCSYRHNSLSSRSCSPTVQCSHYWAAAGHARTHLACYAHAASAGCAAGDHACVVCYLLHWVSLHHMLAYTVHLTRS
jgi:hypothetical protein